MVSRVQDAIELQKRLQRSVYKNAKWTKCGISHITNSLPYIPAVYVLYKAGVPVYVGSARNLHRRMLQHNIVKKYNPDYIKYRNERELGEANMMEIKLIRRFQPEHNVQMKYE